jgi:hypothetical protein
MSTIYYLHAQPLSGQASVNSESIVEENRMISTEERAQLKSNTRGKLILDRLKTETFNQETERLLANHPYLKAAEKGLLTIGQRRAFAQEQYAIQLSDATSFARLAGHSDFTPSSLSNVKTPEPIITPADGSTDLFQFLLGGEVFASSLLLDYATGVGLDERDLSSYQPCHKAQLYPTYWSHMSLSNKRAAGAAACAVNFTAWGGMCRRLYEALRKPELNYGYISDENEIDSGLAFVNFFATPIDGLDQMAAAIIEEENASYEDIVEHVKMLQKYEVMFWDSIFETGEGVKL